VVHQEEEAGQPCTGLGLGFGVWGEGEGEGEGQGQAEESAHPVAQPWGEG